MATTNKKRARIFTATSVVVFDALWIWLLTPFSVCVVTAAPNAARSIRDLPLFVDPVADYVKTSFFTGFFDLLDNGLLFQGPALFSLLLMLVLDGIIIAPVLGLFKSKKLPANDILDAQPESADNPAYSDRYFLRSERDLCSNKTRFTNRTFSSLTNPKGGVYLGSTDARVFMSTEDEHVLLLAPTRVGKTRRVIMPMLACLLESDESIVVCDIKGELCGATWDRAGEKGFKRNRIDFTNPENGNLWNPLSRAVEAYREASTNYNSMMSMRAERETVISQANKEKADDLLKKINKAQSAYTKAIFDAEREVNSVTTMIFPRDVRTEGNATFWNGGAETEIKKALHTVCSMPDDILPPELKTIKTASDIMNDFGRPFPLKPHASSKDTFIPLDEYIRKLPSTHPAFRCMKSNENAEADYRRSFIQTASSRLAQFSSGSISEMMRGTDFPLETLCDEKTITYLIFDEQNEQMKQLAQLFMSQMYKLLTDRAKTTGGRLPRRITVIAEELGQIPPIDSLDNILSISAGKGIRWVLVLQDFAQIIKVYGRDSEPTIVNNCAWTVLLETSDPATERAISERLGERTIEVDSSSTSRKPTGLFNDRYQQSTSLVRRAVLTPAEIDEWNVDQGAILMRRAMKPAVVPMPDISQTRFNTMLGLGSEEANRNNQERILSQIIHPDLKPLPEWNFATKKRNYKTDEDRKAAIERWLRNQAAAVLQERGAQGGGPKHAKKPTQGAKVKNAPQQFSDSVSIMSESSRY